MNRTAPHFLAAVTLGALAALAPAQEKSHDALATPRAKAKAPNQRVLVHLTGGDDAVAEALINATSKDLGKLLRYEYQVAALPASSKPAAALRERLRLRDLDLPVLAVLDTDDAVLDTLNAKTMVTNGAFDVEKVRTFLEKHSCEPVAARRVLADALAVAKKSERDAFVYLSAPW